MTLKPSVLKIPFDAILLTKQFKLILYLKLTLLLSKSSEIFSEIMCLNVIIFEIGEEGMRG